MNTQQLVLVRDFFVSAVTVASFATLVTPFEGGKAVIGFFVSIFFCFFMVAFSSGFLGLDPEDENHALDLIRISLFMFGFSLFFIIG